MVPAQTRPPIEEEPLNGPRKGLPLCVLNLECSKGVDVTFAKARCYEAMTFLDDDLMKMHPTQHDTVRQQIGALAQSESVRHPSRPKLNEHSPNCSTCRNLRPIFAHCFQTDWARRDGAGSKRFLPRISMSNFIGAVLGARGAGGD